MVDLQVEEMEFVEALPVTAEERISPLVRRSSDPTAEPLSPLGSRGTKAWASKVRRRAKELCRTLDVGYMELAQILYHVYDTPIDGDPARGPIYTAWGYSSFREYADAELGLDAKKAERLRLIWYRLEVQLADLDPGLKKRIVHLGYSKVRELIPLLTVRNAEALVLKCETMTYRQIYAFVMDEKQKELGVATNPARAELAAPVDANEVRSKGLNPQLGPAVNEYEETERETFGLYPNQIDNVRMAIQRASEISGSKVKSNNLDLICTEFLATNDVMASDRDRRLRYVAKLERALNLRLVAVDPDTNEIVYGVNTLERLAQEDT